MNNFLNKLTSLYELLNKRVSIDETLEYIYNSFMEYIPYDRIGIVLLDNEGNVYSQAVRTEYAPQLQEGFSVSLSDTSLKTVISSKEHRIINNYMDYYSQNPNSESTRLILKEGIMASVACPLVTNDLCFGVLLFSSKTPNIYSDYHVGIVKMIANQMAITIEKNLLVDELILTTIIGLARLVEAKDSDTGMHLERMQNYSRVIATTLRRIDKYKSIIDNQFINDIFKFSPLHDIGKVGIADGILLKPAKLTPEEFEVMKKHTIIGAEVLRKASTNLLQNGRHFFDMGIEIALSHHEKYNGKGYPYGLSGGAIPLSARIVTVADVFDALTSKRVYKRAMDLDFSLQMITDESGKSFDPDIVEALLNSKEQILEIYEKYHESIDIDRR